MKPSGLFVIFIAVAIPLLWFVPLAASHNDSLAIMSQYLGSVALILMGITQLLATRIKGIEALFGPMDRVYILHKWLAVGAIVTALLHSEIDADVNGIELVAQLSDLAEDIAEIALNGLIFLLVVSLITIIPYKLWKWSHRFIGLFFALAAFHYIYIEKPFSALEPIGLYVTAFCVIGILSYLYLLVPRRLGLNTAKYEVTDVVQHRNVTEIHLQPNGAGISHQPGQFAFINFESAGLTETHPFTISSAPNEQRKLTFMVKALGSYSERLGTALKVGTTARVSAAFGHFSLSKTTTPQVWIGAGIGITPFIAWAQALEPNQTAPTRLYYCVRSRQDALYLAEFEAIATRVPNFELLLVVSGEDKRLSADRIANELNDKLNWAHVYFCGPTPMRESLKAGLREHGLRSSNFHNEEFEIRSGIEQWIQWFRRLFISNK
ncbi:MAG: ferredoxin reductase family protein [Ardenticatenaceae bacterium]